jgi:FtsP/CotA-like multicopper oxidase with cupredoxin domain
MPDGSSMPGTDDGMAGMSMNYNYFTINGKAFPANEVWSVAEGDLVRVRLINISNLVHPMHLHGHDFKVIAKDGEPIRPELQQTMNTIAVNAGETYDIVIRADNPGTWIFHCHELHHTENDGVEPGGLIQAIQYEGVTPSTSAEPSPGETATPHAGH